MIYEYTVITKDNAKECECTIFETFPDCKYVVRTNLKCHQCGDRWITGRGKTFDEAKATAEFHIRLHLFKESVASAQLCLSVVEGIESAVTIKDASNF